MDRTFSALIGAQCTGPTTVYVCLSLTLCLSLCLIELHKARRLLLLLLIIILLLLLLSFTSIASALVEKLPPSLNLFDTRSRNFQNFYRNCNVQQEGFVLTSINEDFIFKELCKLNSSKSTGSDNIPARFVKDAASVSTKPITHIVNFSVQSGIVPRSLKNARVVPLFKKNKRSDVSSYNVLSVVSKILENCTCSTGGLFGEKKKNSNNNNNLLYKLQSGFRSRFSTETCLTYLTDFIRYQTSEGLYTGAILLDLQKAFD